MSAQTKSAVDQFLQKSSHALLFTGSEGAGKGFVARYFSAKKLGLDSLDTLLNHPYFRIIAPVDRSLGIDSIRELQKFLRLKTLGDRPIRRIAVIEDAHTMTHEAQNALLKSLEEPPADTVIILTAPATLQLRDTIYSRVQKLSVLPIEKEQALDFFEDQFDRTAIEKAYLMSGGLTGLLHALLHNEEHALATQIQTARTLLASNTFTRLTKVDELSKLKDQLPVFLQACKLISSTALHQATAKGNTRDIKRWHRALRLLHEAEASLTHNPNPKLLLTHLFVQI